MLTHQVQHLHPDHTGTSQLQALALLQASTLPFDALSDACLRLQNDTSGCVLVLGAWDKARQSLLESLQARQMPVIVFLICRSADEAIELPAHSYQLPIGQIQEILGGL